MTGISKGGTYKLGDRLVNRIGYGAMQLVGSGTFSPPKNRTAAITLLRDAIESGVNHIDTSDFCGPHATNQLIREALHPYPRDLAIVTKVGVTRGADGSWRPATFPHELESAIHDHLRSLKLDVLDVVNLRVLFDLERHGPAEGSIEAPLTALAELRQRGLIRNIGLSNVTVAQVAEGRVITPIAAVQNLYNLGAAETTC